MQILKPKLNLVSRYHRPLRLDGWGKGVYLTVRVCKGSLGCFKPHAGTL